MELVMDRRIVWDPCRLKEIDEAKALIMDFKRQGHVIEKADGTPMERFLPSLAEVIVRAQKVTQKVMKILCDKGDERLVWDKEDGPEAIQAKERFKELLKKNLDDLFTHLIAEPLALEVWGKEHKLVILVDALDEATDAEGKNPLTALITGRFLELPNWICFAVTSRPDTSVLGHLQAFKPFQLSAGDSRNTTDLARYAKEQIGKLEVLSSLSEKDRKKTLSLLVEKAEGMILYLREVSQGLQSCTLKPDDLASMEGGPNGLRSLYYRAFSARLSRDFKESIRPLLRLVVAAPGPLPLNLAADVLGWNRERIRWWRVWQTLRV